MNEPKNGRRDWSHAVISELRKYANLSQGEFFLLAGANYREFLVPYIQNYSIHFEGLSFGNQLKALKQALSS